MIEQRCSACRKVKPLEEMVMGPNKICLQCLRKRSLHYNKEYRAKGAHAAYRNEHRRLRRLIAGWWDSTCDHCPQQLNKAGGEHRDTWKLFPATVYGRRLLATLPKLTLYSLPREELESNFRPLCRPCYNVAVEEEEGCRERMHIVKVRP